MRNTPVNALSLVAQSTRQMLMRSMPAAWKLIEENIDSTDVFAALTNSEEANVLSAMLAKRLGASKVMALVNKPSYGELMENRSIDIVISPPTITIGSLLAHVRRGDILLRLDPADFAARFRQAEANLARDQALAIAYSEKRAAGGKDTESHSSHSAKRSKHYHEKVVATKVYKGKDMMTQARSQKLQNDEDWDE